MIWFCRDEISTRPAETDFTLQLPRQDVTGFHLLLIKKPIDSHSFKNIHKMMKFYRDNCLLLFTSHAS